MDIERIDTDELIACYQIVSDYLKQLEKRKKEVEKSVENEGKN